MMIFWVLALLGFPGVLGRSTISITEPPGIISQADWDTYIGEDCYIASTTGDKRELLGIVFKQGAKLDKDFVIEFYRKDDKEGSTAFYVFCNKENVDVIFLNLGIFFSRYNLKANCGKYSLR